MINSRENKNENKTERDICLKKTSRGNDLFGHTPRGVPSS